MDIEAFIRKIERLARSSDIKKGDRVRLKAIRDDQQNVHAEEEFGVALESPQRSGYLCVQLDEKYWGDDTIDGVIEVPMDQVEKL